MTTDNFYNQNVSVRSVRQENFCVLDLASEKQQHFQSAPNTEINLWRPFSLSRALQWLWSQLLKSLVKTISKTFPWRKGLEKYSILTQKCARFMFSLLDWNAYERSSRWGNNYHTKIFHPHEPPVIYSFHCSREYKKLARYIIRFHGENGHI